MSEHTPGTDPGNRVKVGYLVVGLVFLGIAASWALQVGGVVDGLEYAVLVPAVLVAAGVIGLVAVLLSARHRPGSTDEPTTRIDTQQEDTR